MRGERVEKLPRQWTLKDIEKYTGLTILSVEDRKHWLVATLANGMRFAIKKW